MCFVRQDEAFDIFIVAILTMFTEYKLKVSRPSSAWWGVQGPVDLVRRGLTAKCLWQAHTENLLKPSTPGCED